MEQHPHAPATRCFPGESGAWRSGALFQMCYGSRFWCVSGKRLTESVLGACNVIADVPEDAAAKEAHDQGHHAVHEQQRGVADDLCERSLIQHCQFPRDGRPRRLFVLQQHFNTSASLCTPPDRRLTTRAIMQCTSSSMALGMISVNARMYSTARSCIMSVLCSFCAATLSQELRLKDVT